MREKAFDPQKAQAFAARMARMLNEAALAQMTSIGHQLGLFDALEDLQTITSVQLADALGLDERYVREWLSAMHCGQVLEYAPVDNTYRLPAEHAVALSRSGGSSNWAPATVSLALLAQQETAILDCFRHGGGIPYSAYTRFQQQMAENSALLHEQSLLRYILPLVPGLPARLQAGLDVAEIGCASGHALNLMANAFPLSRFCGFDLSADGVQAGQLDAQVMGLQNVRFEQRDCAELQLSGCFDLIVAFDTIHDLAQPADALLSMARALRPDGVLLMAECAASSRVEDNRDLPLAPFMYTVSCLHCMPVSLAQLGPGLGAMWGEQAARQLLAEAGFTRVEVRQFEGDPLNNYFICSKA